MKELSYRDKARQILYDKKKPPPKNEFNPHPDSDNDRLDEIEEKK